MRLRLITFNIAHGRGLMPHQSLLPVPQIRRNLEKIAEFLRRLEPDVVALQEVDRDSSWNGNFDHIEFLRDRTALPFSAYGANNLGQGRLRFNYGNAILSRLPIVHAENVRFGRLPLGGKGYLYVELAVGTARLLPLVNVHLDHRSRTARRRQVEHLWTFLQARPSPSIAGRRRLAPVCLGDFNCASHVEGDAGRWLLEARPADSGYSVFPRQARTFPSVRPLRMLDFALIPDGFTVGHNTPVRTRLSDHLPVVVDLVPP